MTAQSTNNTASQAVYQKLEHALITDSKAGYSMQDTFFPTQGLSLDLIFIQVNVTVDSMLPKSCSRHPPSPGTSTKFSYCQKFQWSSSPLLNLISVDQLLILDNVISEWIYHTMEHHDFLQFALRIDTLPCDTSEDDLLEALMQLLPQVSTSIHAFCMVFMGMVYAWHWKGVSIMVTLKLLLYNSHILGGI